MSTFWEVATSPFSYEVAKKYTQSIEFSAFVYSMVYVVVVFGGQMIMANRKAFELTRVLNAWNAWLAIFSALGSAFTTYGLFYEIFTRGFVSSYTHLGDFFDGACGWWTWVFVMSKMAEFGDTIILVLRKKPVIFLHWYHHVLTMNYAIYSYSRDTAFNSWITWLNFTVHAIMYGYYMARSMGIKVPAWVAQNITTMQILQFIITHVILFHVAYLVSIGVQVDMQPLVFWWCLVMEISYVILFGNFYYNSYIKGGGKKYQREQKKDKKAE